jgi:hypothetical protein
VTAARINFWNFSGDHFGDTSDKVTSWGNGSGEAGINGGQSGGGFSGGFDGIFSDGQQSGISTGGTGGGFSWWEGGGGVSWGTSNTWDGGITESIFETGGWGNISFSAQSASGSGFDQESVFLDGFSKLGTSQFSKRISKEGTTEFWVFGDFSLETWNESGGVSSDGWVVLVHTNENVDKVTHLVESVEFGELFWDEKLVGIGGEILMKPDGEAILTGGWGGRSVSWDPRGNTRGGWDDGRH